MTTRTATLLCALCAIVGYAVALSALAEEPLLTAEFVARINEKSKGMWQASENNGYLLAGATRSEIQRMLGVKKSAKEILPKKVFSDAELSTPVPPSFDAATQWPTCKTITHIRDQSACGSCWAVAAAEAMSDRYCVGGGQKDLEISAATLMECCWYCGQGCEGGDPSSAWQYWVSSGLYDDGCQPYPFPKCAHHQNHSVYPPCPQNTYPTPACSTQCTNKSGTPTVYKGDSSYSLSGESAFQTELVNHGPFEVAFDVYEDFLAYTGGVYTRTSNQYLGGHAVRVVGWGELNGVAYWKIANSWNSDWGLNGYFLIRRGVDECGIEDSGSAGLAHI